MKSLYKITRIFYSNRYLLVTWIVAPVLSALLGFFLGKIEPIMAVVFASIIAPLFDIVGDFFVFNGCFDSKAPTRLITSSFYGRKLMAGGLLCDQLRRFIFLTLCGSLFLTLGGAIGKGDIHIMVLFILIMYAIDTFSLLFLRYMTFFWGYAMISGFITSLTAVLVAIAYILFCNNMLFFPFWIIPALVATLGSTIAVVEIHRNAYEKSIGR